jgi:hypothetical protein
VFDSAVFADAGDQTTRAAAGRFFERAALRRRQGLPAMTAAASCSARRCSPTPAIRQHALLLVGSSGARLSAAAKGCP